MNNLNSVLIEGLVTDIRNVPGPNVVVQLDVLHLRDDQEQRFFANVNGKTAERCIDQVQPGFSRVQIVGTLQSTSLGTASIKADHVTITNPPRQEKTFRVEVQVHYTVDVDATSSQEAEEKAAEQVVDNGEGTYDTYTITDVQEL